MPENDGTFEETRQALAVRWEVAAEGEARDAGDYAVLLEELTRRVSHMLIYQHQKLMASLYVLDISERRYKEAMAGTTHAARAAALARAIMERETEKIASRRKYAKAPHEGIEGKPSDHSDGSV